MALSYPSSGTVPSTPVSPALARIVVIATGGTIAGSAADPMSTACYQAGVLTGTQLLAALPALDTVARIEVEQIANIDSKEMSPALWTQLARRVQCLVMRDDVEGIVITHGSDTLEETAFLLHLSIKSAKPIVLTAAMRPATALCADGPMNLLDALTVAAAPAAIGRGALVVLNQQIHCARDVTKTHTYAVDTFRSSEGGALGWVQDGRVEFQRAPQRRHTAHSEFEVPAGEWPRVEIVQSYAGVSRIVVDALVAAGVHGIVAAGSGNGSLPLSLQQALSAAVTRGIVVVRASRVGRGHVMHNGAEPDDALGFVSAGSLHPYKARVLLMLALAHTPCCARAHVQRMFDMY